MNPSINISISSKKNPMSFGRKVLITILSILTIATFSFAIFVFIITRPISQRIDETDKSKVRGTYDIDKDKAVNSQEIQDLNYDLEITEPYKADLQEYLEQLIFFLYLNDSAYRLMEQDIAKEKDYINLIRLNGELCPYVEYEGSMEEVPKDIETKLNNIETLNIDFCNKLVESSALMTDYLDTTELQEMKDLITRIREINGDNYENRLLIEKISNEILSLMGIEKIFD